MRGLNSWVLFQLLGYLYRGSEVAKKKIWEMNISRHFIFKDIEIPEERIEIVGKNKTTASPPLAFCVSTRDG